MWLTFQRDHIGRWWGNGGVIDGFVRLRASESGGSRLRLENGDVCELLDLEPKGSGELCEAIRMFGC